MTEPAAAPAIDALYEQRLGERRSEAARLERGHMTFGTIRLLLAAAALLTLVTVGVVWAWLATIASLFLVAAIFHALLLVRRGKASRAVGFYEAGLRRIRHAWIGTGRTGTSHRPADHLLADDLDLFGRGSLFELLCTTRTQAGEETLARWMTSAADADVIRARQGAVQELAGRLDLRETIGTIGDDVRAAVDAPVLRRWAATPGRGIHVALRVALALLSTATTLTFVWWWRTGEAEIAALMLVIVQLLVAWSLLGRVQTVIKSVEEPAHDLDVLATLLRVLERERFTSPHLVALVTRLDRDVPASRQIAQLARLVAMLASRRNVLFAIPAAAMLWGTQWALAIEAWRVSSGRRIPTWLDVVGEFEALVAVGGFAAEHPTHVVPTIVEGGPVIEARDLKHPTIGAEAVGNDIRLGGSAVHVSIVSGSNMSGKSTWLRSIGATVVLANLGAPVRATSCRLSPLAIGAAIRVEDSLTDGRSRFFAEITRMRAIVDLTEQRGGHLIFLLDEMLGGTNSHDRRVGAEALIQTLVAAGAIGLVTTHDLALGEIAARLDGLGANQHFADQFTDGVLHFDYRIRPGVVQTSNALELMRSIGLRV